MPPVSSIGSPHFKRGKTRRGSREREAMLAVNKKMVAASQREAKARKMQLNRLAMACRAIAALQKEAVNLRQWAIRFERGEISNGKLLAETGLTYVEIQRTLYQAAISVAKVNSQVVASTSRLSKHQYLYIVGE